MTEDILWYICKTKFNKKRDNKTFRQFQDYCKSSLNKSIYRVNIFSAKKNKTLVWKMFYVVLFFYFIIRICFFSCKFLYWIRFLYDLWSLMFYDIKLFWFNWESFKFNIIKWKTGIIHYLIAAYFTFLNFCYQSSSFTCEGYSHRNIETMYDFYFLFASFSF